jgi:hypothetical protein
MKTYIPIILVVVALVGVVFGGRFYMKKHSPAPKPETAGQVQMKTYSGEVMRVFEGENKISYSFEIPETATATVSMDGALISITDNNMPYATVYISYEGGRGYSPIDYITDIIASHVTVLNIMGTSTIGAYDWQIAESAGSEWHIATAGNDQWLFIVENKKTVHDHAQKLLESVKAK